MKEIRIMPIQKLSISDQFQEEINQRKESQVNQKVIKWFDPVQVTTN